MNQKITGLELLNFNRFIKYLFDRIIAVIALIVLAPLMLGIAIAIYLNMGSPIIFMQARTGKNAGIFNLYKFRTLTNKQDSQGNLLPDAERLTTLGKFLRQSSLDELPQFWNVLKGDMSFVGPRPLVVRYLNRYTAEQARRHEVLPGITGLAQVQGRNTISWEEKFQYDVWYVDNWSLWLDLKILFLTIRQVLQQEGITQEGQTTSEEFIGQIHNQIQQIQK